LDVPRIFVQGKFQKPVWTWSNVVTLRGKTNEKR
jgi:hypothetical protein